jgi:hypothetical protein
VFFFLFSASVQAEWSPFANIWDQTIPQTAFEAQDHTIYDYKKVFHSSYDIEGNEEGTPIRQVENIIYDANKIPRQRYFLVVIENEFVNLSQIRS